VLVAFEKPSVTIADAVAVLNEIWLNMHSRTRLPRAAPLSPEASRRVDKTQGGSVKTPTPAKASASCKPPPGLLQLPGRFLSYNTMNPLAPVRWIKRPGRGG
jgi:hypothetical protein